MSSKTSASTVFADAAPTAGFQRVWNRRLQQWVEVPLPAGAAAADADPQAGVSANAFASGSNQNSGNCMTGRSTTRVAAPPGGKSSFSLSYAEESATPTRAPVTTIPAATAVNKGTSANAFACGANQNSGNYVTDKPTTRVAQPPGGKSSFVMG